MTICTINVRITPKTHMNPYISRLVSNYEIRWNIYHMLLVKLNNLLQRKTLFGPKIGVKITICTCHVRKTPNTHMKPDIRRLVSIYAIGWNIYHVMSVKFRNSIPTKYPFLSQNECQNDYLHCNVRKTPKTHMKPYISRLVSVYGIRWNIFHMWLVKLRNSMAT